MDEKTFRVYCLLSDAEHQAGNLWEGAMFAGANKLSNLTCVVDRNNIQINGMTEETMPLEPLREKYEAFNWHVIEVDGHNIEAFVDATEEAKAIYEKPTAIIAWTLSTRDLSPGGRLAPNTATAEPKSDKINTHNSKEPSWFPHTPEIL